MTIQLTILGLGQIGTSFGLALAEQKDRLFRVGHDADLAAMREAEKLGALDKTAVRLQAAVENADIVILALPVDEVRSTLEFIVQDLKEGAVVLDTSPLQVSALEWAKELLPAGRYYVTLHPSLNPAYFDDRQRTTASARADLFKNGITVISAPENTEGDALKLAADLTKLIGATPYFADPYEADGLLAWVELLPKLGAAALVRTVQDQPGWREARKLTSNAYALGTSALLRLDEINELGQSALLNRENVSRVLSEYIQRLQMIRALLDQNDAAGLKHLLESARDDRAAWLDQRTKAEWEPVRSPELPTSGDMLGRLIGLRPDRKKKN